MGRLYNLMKRAKQLLILKENCRPIVRDETDIELGKRSRNESSLVTD